jgi:RNA-binding protein
MSLNKTQIKILRAESHRMKLKPVVTIGQNGLSENVQNEIEIALEHHELIKIRIPVMDKTAKKQMIDTICTRTNAILITAIGSVAVIYRRTDNVGRFSKLLSG